MVYLANELAHWAGLMPRIWDRGTGKFGSMGIVTPLVNATNAYTENTYLPAKGGKSSV